jgi:hypothetical protein
MSEDTNLLPQVTEEKSGRSVVQQLVKEVTIGVAVVYAIGMLTTNVYLSRLGFTDFNLIRPKCIITGSWAALLMLACCGPALSLDRFKNGKITKKRLAEELFAGYAVAAGLGLILLCSSVSLEHIRGQGHSSAPSVVGHRATTALLGLVDLVQRRASLPPVYSPHCHVGRNGHLPALSRRSAWHLHLPRGPSSFRRWQTAARQAGSHDGRGGGMEANLWLNS